MRISVKIGAAALSTIALTLTMLSPAYAGDTESDRQPAQITEAVIRDDLTQLGVSATQVGALLEKLESGAPWDSVNGAHPVSTENLVVDGFNVTREYFADGSITEYGVEVGVPATQAQLNAMIAAAAPYVSGGSAAVQTSSPSITPMAAGVRYCTTGMSAGVFYASDCEVYYHGISWSSAFTANYQRWAGGASAQYVPASAFTIAYTLCVTSENVTSLENNTRIRYSVTLAPVCIGNIPFWLDLKVTSSLAYAATGP